MKPNKELQVIPTKVGAFILKNNDLKLLWSLIPNDSMQFAKTKL